MLVQNDKIYFYHNDHRGAPESITSESGAVVWDADYTSFGKALINHGEIKNNLRLPGQYYDEETGLHYNWNRYYDPFVGRYLTADPIGLAGGINLYNYVGGNPVNRVDPEGEYSLVVDTPVFDPETFLPEIIKVSSPQGIAIQVILYVFTPVSMGDGTLPPNYLNESRKKLKEKEGCEQESGEEGDASKKPSSPGKMQKEIERGQAPKDIERVDKGHVPLQEPHVHYKDGTSSTQSGDIHDAHKGTPNLSKKVRDWLEKHGWKIPNN